MILIMGGAYQGKLEYAREKYNIAEEDIFFCSQDLAQLDLNKKLIYGLENFTFACVKEGLEAKTILEQNIDKLSDKIIICADISQGIVPMDKDQRDWREMTGRAMLYLGKQADTVTRVFCGLAHQLK